jgi:mannose-6-phosphate isomerase-like protein (cupin superfamily)
MSETTQDPVGLTSRFLLDPYVDWAKGENIPIHQDFGLDLLALETKRWDRYDAKGCFAHTHGRGDFMANYVIEVEPGRKTAPIKHLYEAFFYVLSGHGSTIVWLPNGETRTFEWGPKALFAVPLNCKYQIFNGSGQESARLSCTNDAPLTINLYHNLDSY